MNVLIVGNGRTGSTLARSLASSGHAIALIDSDPETASALSTGDTANITFIHGDGTRDSTLERAGIRNADIFAALTGDDSTNGLAALKARLTYRVMTVIASAWSGDLTSVYESLGVACVNPARLSSDAVLSNVPQVLQDQVSRTENE